MSRPSEFGYKLVYDCTYTGTAVALKTDQVGSQAVNGKYYDKLPNFYTLKGTNDTTLIFESRFESGNLLKAFQINEFEYDLELKQDHGASVVLT